MAPSHPLPVQFPRAQSLARPSLQAPFYLVPPLARLHPAPYLAAPFLGQELDPLRLLPSTLSLSPHRTELRQPRRQNHSFCLSRSHCSSNSSRGRFYRQTLNNRSSNTRCL